ncbi:4827_t:CDS:2 [Paraglomus occultum]|uniref:4827_t:CDS:1 n=1 Tax=Paraglomus occultum TaxID=144539 RepID=A0A9N8WLQ9_9GLOM|nr:4827_t:CDS:2 [Paraglomus occultum]
MSKSSYRTIKYTSDDSSVEVLPVQLKEARIGLETAIKFFEQQPDDLGFDIKDLRLTEDKLEEWGLAGGSILAIVDFIEKLRGEEYESSSKRGKVEEDMTTSRKRKYDEEENGSKHRHLDLFRTKIPFLILRINVRCLTKKLSNTSYLNAMEHSLKQNQVTVQTPSLWTESRSSYIDDVLKKSGDEFKMEIMRKIEGDESNKFRLYCEKVLMDFYNLVDVFPHLLRNRKYIVQNVSSLFKFYESTFGNLYFDWIETHSSASKLIKSRIYSGIAKVDVKEIFHANVSGPPSSSSQHGRAVIDTTKSIHTDILNLVAILLDYLRAPVEIATKIKVFSLQGNPLYDGDFHEEITKQISVMENLDLTIDYNEGGTVRDVLKIPKPLKDLLREYGK